MFDDATLLPPVGEINKRLTVVARQQHRLRRLLKLAVEARDDAERFGLTPPTPLTESARPEGVAS
jgi:hypothetical protein